MKSCPKMFSIRATQKVFSVAEKRNGNFYLDLQKYVPATAVNCSYRIGKVIRIGRSFALEE
jgi:hypothetical protein